MNKTAFFTSLLIAALLCMPAVGVSGSSGPVAMLEELTQQLTDIAEGHPEYLDDPAALRRVADEMVLPHVDFTMLARLVLGRHWRSADAGQRAAFEAGFRELLMGTYLRSVSAYKDNTIRYQPLRHPPVDGQAKVHALIEQVSGPPVHVSFRMYRANDRWKIFDVIVEGVSLIATHRSSFSRLIREHGMEHVIEQLRTKNYSNAAGEQ